MSAPGSVTSAAVLAEAPWGRGTVLIHLSLYLIPAITAWTSTLTATVLIPVVALALTLCIGACLLVSRTWRKAGWRIIAGTVVAAGLEVVLTVVLVFAYSAANPGWDLS